MLDVSRGSIVVVFAAIAIGCGSSPGGATSTGSGGAGATSTGVLSGSDSTTVGPSSTVSTGSGSCVMEPTHMGDGTYYDATGAGNCSFDPSPNDLMVGAMNHTDYQASAACGACAAITGPSGMVTVRIVDQCPECQPGDIDLSPQAFSKLADLALGRISITWQYVPCDVMGPIVYHYKEGSNPYWTAIQIRNARYAIATVEAKGSDGNYANIARVDYNFFVADQGLGAGPYSFRVTDVHGHALEDSGVPFVDSGDAPGVGQFPACAP